jgi:glycosyltransferase involved in cell wall biosynthesis
MKKKILYIHHGKGLGGAPLSLLYLIQKLDSTLYEPIVLFLYQSDAMDLYKSQGITIYGPVNRSDFPHTKIWWHRWYHVHHLLRTLFDTLMTILFDARQWLMLLKPDIVHLNTSSLIAWAFIAHRLKIPVVWHVREPLANGYFGIRKKIITWCINRYATKIIPISLSDGAPWIEHPKTTVLYNPVDVEKFHPAITATAMQEELQLTAEKKIILFVGGISREKGTDIIIAAFNRLAKVDKNCILIIAGYNRSESTSFRRFFMPSFYYSHWINTNSKKISDRIIFTGPTNKIPELMALSDVVVFPATIGHFARPVIEAACMAKPVIASALPPLDEIVIDKNTGFLVPPFDTQKWVRALHSLLNNKYLAHKMGENAYKESKKYQSDLYAKRIEHVYQNILQGDQ